MKAPHTRIIATPSDTQLRMPGHCIVCFVAVGGAFKGRYKVGQRAIVESACTECDIGVPGREERYLSFHECDIVAILDADETAL